MTNHPTAPGVASKVLEPPAGLRRVSRQPGWAAAATTILVHNIEGVLVLVLLGSLLFINFFVVHKFAFLLFYFLPVLMAGFYLGVRHAVSAAVLVTGFAVYLTLWRPVEPGIEDVGFGFWNLLVWSSFLVLTGAIVGKLQDRNRIQMEQLREAYVGIIQILTKYLEAADAYTKSHSERVASVSGILAEQLGLSHDEAQNVWTGALLHDIGKIEVVELIKKAADLDQEEKAKVDQHTLLGAQLLMTTGSILQEAIPIVLEHHRRYEDGGDAIPVGARIVAVADAYDAILSDRPYRAGRMHWEAVEMLKGSAGTHFDPKVVAALEAASNEVQALYGERR
ncbi:MAG: HD domain-containing protein [Gemmatimonadales bacterium]|nr:HD domain-containing protein [Gemmatimonadales bacterium]NIN11753.1 HD domain-containing protein [Gemmatimonadales bacterium]NIQ99200.1 HD domain-containing protein [Gemmatimonadales bacterium]NIS63973.1 HD domain-containing protein [Gemmatimonadales bacterium]